MNTIISARPARTHVRAPNGPTLSAGFAALLAEADAAWLALDAIPAGHDDRGQALRRWSAACLLLVTGIRTRADAQALHGLDGRSTDDWIDFLVSLGVATD